MKINNFQDYNSFLANRALRSFEGLPQKNSLINYYKKCKIFTIIASVLAVILFTENIFFILERTILKHNQYFVLFFLTITVITIIFIFIAYYLYKNLSLDFLLRDLIFFVVTEIIFIVSEFFIMNKPLSFLFIVLIIYSVVFVVYLFVGTKETVKTKVIFLILQLAIFFVMYMFRAVEINYTARYFYFSENGYSNSENIDTSYFCEFPILQEDYESILEVTNTYAHQTIPIDSNEFSAMQYPIINGKSMQEIFSELNDYNESFFNNNCIELTVVELENPNDRISCNAFYGANGYSNLSLTYSKSNTDSVSNKALCVIIFECSNNQKDLLLNMYSIKSEFVDIAYN